jgi:hypothetical protein
LRCHSLSFPGKWRRMIRLYVEWMPWMTSQNGLY